MSLDQLTLLINVSAQIIFINSKLDIHIWYLKQSNLVISSIYELDIYVEWQRFALSMSGNTI